MVDSTLTDFLTKHCRLVTEQDAPALHDALKELTAKANHPEAKFDAVHFITEKAVKTLPGLDYFASCIKQADGKKHLLLGPGLRSILGHTDMKSEVTPKLKAVIAHELGHATLDMGFGKRALAAKMPLIGITAGIAGVAVARTLWVKHQRNKELQQQELQAHHEAYAQSPSKIQTFGKAVLYIAGALLGLELGLRGKSHLMHSIEYRADKFGAGLMDSGKELAGALRAIHTKQVELEEDLFRAMEEKGQDSSLARKVLQYRRESTHPSMGGRIERMENWSR